MKKALKAAIGLLVVSLTFSSCELFLFGMLGEGSVASPHYLSSGFNSCYVGYNGDGRYSYYYFTVPSGKDLVTITCSSTSGADLYYYLYSSSSFTSSISSNIAYGTPSTWFDEYPVTSGRSYYLKVYNYTDSGTVDFTLTLDYPLSYSLSTMSSANYQSRNSWTLGYLPAGNVHWYALDVNYASSEVYIHWQDSDRYNNEYSQPGADIKVSVYAANKTTLLASIQDNGYSIDYWNVSSVNGIGVTDATRYWVKVEGYSSSSRGSYYLSAVEVPVD